MAKKKIIFTVNVYDSENVWQRNIVTMHEHYSNAIKSCQQYNKMYSVNCKKNPMYINCPEGARHYYVQIDMNIPAKWFFIDRITLEN